ncbi:hypothetical protein ASAC_0862 [Acidilobus saccharovorans 345-15]|uniref:Right handed beta helix domain-containing protein n=2 Tax=Acidilobus TaxID=105850 RepID=D9Q1T0_ACIS3|nr:hypothetical protein ASAC_0862 [Acidilobus saccharovorans 345-15]
MSKEKHLAFVLIVFMALVTITALVGEPLGALAAHGRPASSFSVGENANSVYSASKDPVEITGPINITKPGYYVIASNISVCSDNYTIGVFASNVIINGEGHVITGCRVIIGVGVVKSVGILINNASNVTIEDLVVRKYYYVVNGSGNDIRVINASLEKGLTADLQLWGNNISIYNAFVPSSGRGINITGNNITIYKVNTFGDYIGVAVNGNQVKLERVTNPDNSYGIVVNGDYVTVIGGASSSRFGATFNGSHISVVNSTFNVESGLYGKSYGVGVRGSYVTMLNVTAGSGQVSVEVNGSYVNLSDIEANGDSIGILINGSHVNVDSVTIYTARVGVEAFGSHIRLSGLSLSYNVVYNGTGATGLLVKGENINMSEVREAGYTYDINSTGTNITISDSELWSLGAAAWESTSQEAASHWCM